MIIYTKIGNFDTNDPKEYGFFLFRFGKDFINTSKFLFVDEKRLNNLSYGLLFVTGIELVLKSFLSIYNNTKKDDLWRNYGHDYKKAYDDCVKIDKTDGLFQDKELEQTILFLDKVFPNSIQCRFFEDKSRKKDKFYIETDSFTILQDKLLGPLQNKYIADFNFTP